ncbi:DUF1848 family protein [Methanocrinis sp.]|uniref:DUF1848 family protein n=1 Tax=Methanocrinis sp. TaxID=3101522 RepID=UPI003D0F4399
MIISASYKTDIPAFYGEWFEKRLEAGYCKVANPYNRRQVRRVSLAREDVDGFVFWTRNLGPFLGRLERVRDFGRPFTVQQTITGYPRELEPSVVDARRSVRHLRAVAERYGPRAAVWRYDPILFTSLTPAEYHLDNFERLAGALVEHPKPWICSMKMKLLSKRSKLCCGVRCLTTNTINYIISKIKINLKNIFVIPIYLGFSKHPNCKLIETFKY